MTFYQELQLNQAGSKNLLKKSETVKEKSYHILVYLVKIAVTMAFCFLFVTIFSILFGNENSIVGVVVLLCLMVFRNADLGIHTGQSTMLNDSAMQLPERVLSHDMQQPSSLDLKEPHSSSDILQ